MLNSFLFYCSNNRPKASDTLMQKGRRRSFAPHLHLFILYMHHHAKPHYFKTHYFLMTTFLVLPFDLMIYTPLPEIWFT